ncbi:MAG: glutamate racemase [Patescibacteria group bacterium]|nr:glutamate racemase [Patescibacteria group bacterium]
MNQKIKIGVFDSGIGGLWILKHLRKRLSGFDYVFVGDRANVPYGNKSLVEVKELSDRIVEFLIKKGCKLIVIACNTASTAALNYLREKYKDINFVGMEPAIKPAVETTKTGKVGVLATSATFQGELYNLVIEKFANGVEVFQDTCPGLVQKIEENKIEESYEILEKALRPMMEKGIDKIVLGCTHYSYTIPIIKKITDIEIIDPTPAIVNRVESIVGKLENKGSVELFSSGEFFIFEGVKSNVLE